MPWEYEKYHIKNNIEDNLQMNDRHTDPVFKDYGK
jgi:hypothetical protein